MCDYLGTVNTGGLGTLPSNASQLLLPSNVEVSRLITHNYTSFIFLWQQDVASRRMGPDMCPEGRGTSGFCLHANGKKEQITDGGQL